MTTASNITSVAEYRERRQQGEEWTAPSGAVVLVRDIDITDNVVINEFPEYLRQVIYKGIAGNPRLSGQSDEADESDDNFLDGISGEEVLQREREIGIKLLTLGWINPRVVEVVTDPDTELGVDEVSAADRRAFMAKVLNGYQTEAQQLSPFPGGSNSSVGTVPGVQAVPAPAERPAPAGAAILRADGV